MVYNTLPVGQEVMHNEHMGYLATGMTLDLQFLTAVLVMMRGDTTAERGGQ